MEFLFGRVFVSDPPLKRPPPLVEMLEGLPPLVPPLLVYVENSFCCEFLREEARPLPRRTMPFVLFLAKSPPLPLRFLEG